MSHTQPSYRRDPRSAPSRDFVELCDLCQKSFKETDIASHVSLRHPSLVRFTNEFSAVADSSPVDVQHITKLGSTARLLGESSDGGVEKFDFAMRALQQARIVVRTVDRKATLFAFGSVVTLGVWDGDSDIDLTFVDPDGWIAKKWPPEDEPYLIKKLCRVLRDAGFSFSDLEPVLHTRVPVVRRKLAEKPLLERRQVSTSISFRTLVVHLQRAIDDTVLQSFASFIGVPIQDITTTNPETLNVVCRDTTQAVEVFYTLTTASLPRSLPRVLDVFYKNRCKPELFLIDFDLSCRGHGIRNSLLIRAYLSQSVLVRCGSVLIKKWSKRSAINNSMRGFLTSYAVQILWIYYLVRKRRVTFILPTDAAPARPDPHMKYNYMSLRPVGDVALFEEDLGALIYGFFTFYATEFDWDAEVVSLRQEAPMKKTDVGWTLDREVHSLIFKERVWYRFCIDDPYEDNLNLGRHLSPIKAAKVKAEFVYAVYLIQRGRTSILMRDRSADVAHSRCRRAAAEYLIDQERVALSDLIEHLQAKLLPDLASFEVNQQFTKLLEIIGMEITNDGTEGFYSRAKRLTHFVTDLSRVRQIANDLDSAGALGLQITPELENLGIHHALFDYHEESKRIFSSLEHLMEFESYFNTVKSIAGRVRSSEFQRLARETLAAQFDAMLSERLVNVIVGLDCWQENAPPRVIGAFRSAEVVPTDEGVPSMPPVINRNVTALNKAAPEAQLQVVISGVETAPLAQKVHRGLRSRKGMCSQCGRTGSVSDTNNQLLDNGWYCDACWESWGS